jgi:ion channel-forming bestrophin family protein
MITYNPKDWFRLIFQFHRSDTFRILLPTMVLLGAATGGVVYLQQNGYAHIRTSTVFHQILGFALSMLLVFRINTAYERWWEGRKLWGSLVNNSRSLMAKLHATLSTVAPDDLTVLRSAIAVFPSILRDHLRDLQCAIPEHEAFPENRLEFAQSDHKPLYAYTQILSRIEKLRRNKVISDEQLLVINSEIFSLIDITGACERIKNSPIPFSYSLFLKKSLFVYIITMPIPFSAEFGYWAMLAVMVIFYTFASLELVSEEVEEPFGTEANDLPTDELADKIYANVMSIGR